MTAAEFYELRPVVAVEDEDSHWYVIPAELSNRFSELLDFSIRHDNHDLFIEEFGKYRTGGDLNLVQLWAKI